MARRRKYDTEALVGQMRAERRTALILSLAGVFILGFLLTLYITGIGGEEDVPEVPKEDPDTAVTGVGGGSGAGGAAGALEAGAGGAGPVEPEPEPEPEPEVGGGEPGKVKVSLSKKGVLWVDGEKVGKVKGKDLELSPGSHTLKAKVGKKTVEATLEVASGGAYAVSFHHKKKTAEISEGGSDAAAPAAKKKKKKKKKKR